MSGLSLLRGPSDRQQPGATSSKARVIRQNTPPDAERRLPAGQDDGILLHAACANLRPFDLPFVEYYYSDSDFTFRHEDRFRMVADLAHPGALPNSVRLIFQPDPVNYHLGSGGLGDVIGGKGVLLRPGESRALKADLGRVKDMAIKLVCPELLVPVDGQGFCDPDTVARSILYEAQMYLHELQELQGKVIPHCYGFFRAYPRSARGSGGRKVLRPPLDNEESDCWLYALVLERLGPSIAEDKDGVTLYVREARPCLPSEWPLIPAVARSAGCTSRCMRKDSFIKSSDPSTSSGHWRQARMTKSKKQSSDVARKALRENVPNCGSSIWRVASAQSRGIPAACWRSGQRLPTWPLGSPNDKPVLRFTQSCLSSAQQGSHCCMSASVRRMYRT